MENFWTSKEPIHGLRHFVLINQDDEKGPDFFLMVSVLDSEINLKITFEELFNSGNWVEGWLSLTKLESITKDYVLYKSLIREKKNSEIFITDYSLFDIF